MITLHDLFPARELADAIDNGYVVRRTHADYPLAILNYTDRCQHSTNAWNRVTMQCRGLIHNVETMEVVARPFRKFFNYGERNAPMVDLDATAIVTDKLDGSLAIGFPTPDGYALATRGSFNSPQALHATEIWRKRYAHVRLWDGWTHLFEICFPGNRIVVDYGDLDDLIFLQSVHIATGQSHYFPAMRDEWPGPSAQRFTARSLREALELRPRENAEGLVVHLIDTDERVKIKQEDYVRLHRIVSGLHERAVWEHLAAGKPLTELLEPLPEEFHAWVGQVAQRLVTTINLHTAEIERTYLNACKDLPLDFTRKQFAMKVKKHPLAWAIFNRFDGKDYRAQLWKNVKPEPRRTPLGWVQTQEAA